VILLPLDHVQKNNFYYFQPFDVSARLESLLSQQDGVNIVGRTTNPDLALEQIKMLQPDVVIVDSTRLSIDSSRRSSTV